MLQDNLSPFVSVIVPTFNDGKILEKCLTSLENQTYPKDCYEILVINNNPRKNISATLKAFKQVRGGLESQPGSYAARNKGIGLARGEVLAFTDADCIPAPDWIHQGVENLKQSKNCGLLAGAIQVICRNSSQPTAVELYDLIHAFPQKRYVESDHYGATANVFTFKHIFEVVGQFDATLQSGGDFEWGQRVHQAGYQVLYADDVKIAHPARYSWHELSKKNRRVVKGHHILMKRNLYSPWRFFGALFADLLMPYRIAPSILRERQLTGYLQRLKVTSVAVFVRYVRGWQRLRLKLDDLMDRPSPS